jgi:hypothetical protein
MSDGNIVNFFPLLTPEEKLTMIRKLRLTTVGALPFVSEETVKKMFLGLYSGGGLTLENLGTALCTCSDCDIVRKFLRHKGLPDGLERKPKRT